MNALRKVIVITGIVGFLLFAANTAMAANLALGKTAYGSDQQEGNPAQNLTDGSYEARWSVQGYGNYVTIDLGKSYYLGHTLMYTSVVDGRGYAYTIEVGETLDSLHLVADKTDNTESRDVHYDNMNGEYGRYVRLTITGGTASGEWISIYEFEVYPYADEVNWAILGKISEFSAQQNDNNGVHLATHIIDNSLDTRWSAEHFPNHVTVDLGEPRVISRTEVVPIESRAYKFNIEASMDGIRYFKIVDRSNNGTPQEVISDEFTPVRARFIRLTVTGFNGDSEWISISEFRVLGPDLPNTAPVINAQISINNKFVSATAKTVSMYGGSVTLVAVVFDGDKMVEIKREYIELGEYGETVSGSITLTSDLTGKTVEAFIWDNDETMLSCSDTFVK